MLGKITMCDLPWLLNNGKILWPLWPDWDGHFSALWVENDPNSEGEEDTTESVSDSESPELSDSESVADAKGEGHFGSHKNVGEIRYVT